MWIAGPVFCLCFCFEAMANASKHLQPSSQAGNDKKYQGTLVASPAKAISPKCVNRIVPSKQLILGGGSIGHVASFLIKVVALEAVRRVSKTRCPFIWNSVQALQILVYPPFSWIQRWAPLRFLVQGIQVIWFLSSPRWMLLIFQK